MKVENLVVIIEEGEKICIQDRDQNVLEMENVESLSKEYMNNVIIKIYSEHYITCGTTGITILIED